MLGLDGGQWPAGRDLGEDGVRVDVEGLQHVAQGLLVAEGARLLVTVGEQRPVRLEEAVGQRVAHGDADLQTEEAAVGVRVVPHIGLTVLDVDLAQREGQERDVPVALELDHEIGQTREPLVTHRPERPGARLHQSGESQAHYSR